jgi:hypothetical protein
MGAIRTIIIGAACIVGGLSGQLVFIGTSSSEALIPIGAVLIVLGVIQLVRENQAYQTAPTAQRIRVGERAVVHQEAVVYTEMDSRSAPVTKLDPGDAVNVVAASERNDVEWLCVGLPEGKQGYVLAYKFQ